MPTLLFFVFFVLLSFLLSFFGKHQNKQIHVRTKQNNKPAHKTHTHIHMGRLGHIESNVLDRIRRGIIVERSNVHRRTGGRRRRRSMMMVMMIVRGGLRQAIEHRRQLSRGDGGVPQHSLPKYLRRRDFRRRCRRVCRGVMSAEKRRQACQIDDDATG
jgi:hypothetical protein